MRTSSQLTPVEQCERHPRANITQTDDHITRAIAQKKIIIRSLQGEPISDICGEIDSILASHRCYFENTAQKSQNLHLYALRIQRYINWERNNNREIIFPQNMDTVVDFFGENIKVNADYFVRTAPSTENARGEIHVVKIKPSRFSTEKADIETYETYALGLLGKKLFPNDNIVVEINHLGDVDTKTERAAINHPYDYYKAQKQSLLNFNNRAIEYFETKHNTEMQNPTVCSPEDCASCSMNNICHFIEPPISVDVMKEVKPISEIRLTYAQQQVINYEKGIARINAGAGAGKTLVVAMRIVELLKKGYQPEDICLLTFTNAGAEEMTARVIQYCTGNGIEFDSTKLTSTTFNAFCQEILNAYYDELGYTAQPRIIPDETRSGIINRILDQYPRIEEWNYSSASNGMYNRFNKSALNVSKQMFAEIKKERYTREKNPYESQYNPVSLDLIFQMYDEFERQLKSRNMVEYDDQLLKVFDLLEIHPSLFDEIGYKHIIVDEFQDTDLPQIQLLNNIINNASFKSFMAVGDDSQSIFAFRHTSPEFMINFQEYFGRFDDFNLVENHRSAGDIIELANKVNAMNTNRVEKDLIATKENGTGPIINGFYSQKSEYTWIAEEIRKEIENGRTPSDIAFLASDRTELTKMASILTEMGIPSILMNPVPYIDNSRVAAIATFFESYTEGTTRGLLDYKNALMHGALANATAVELEAIADEFGEELHSAESTTRRFMDYANALDPDKTDECYQSFLEKIERCETIEELSEFFRDFKLYGADSKFKREGKYEGVCLTTVHSAKGLEWDVTYLSVTKFDNPRNHSLSSRLRGQTPEQQETNRKLFVGTTRAREKLVITGEYVTKFTQKELILNDYVKTLYDMLGKPYGYSSTAYWATKALEKDEATKKGGIVLPDIYKMTERDKEKLEEQKQPPTRNGHSIMDIYRGNVKVAPASTNESPALEENMEGAEIEFI